MLLGCVIVACAHLVVCAHMKVVGSYNSGLCPPRTHKKAAGSYNSGLYPPRIYKKAAGSYRTHLMVAGVAPGECDCGYCTVRAPVVGCPARGAAPQPRGGVCAVAPVVLHVAPAPGQGIVLLWGSQQRGRTVAHMWGTSVEGACHSGPENATNDLDIDLDE